MKPVYKNITVRVRKFNVLTINEMLNNSRLEYLTVIETGKLALQPVYRYTGDDIPSIGLYYDDLIIEG